MTGGVVSGIISNLVTVRCDGPVGQNEICYIEMDGLRLMAEVIKIRGDTAFTQVYESTRGVRTGQKVIFTGRMLEADLGPGMLSRIYDGLQNDLNKIDTLFLERGSYTDGIDGEARFDFEPIAAPGDEINAADWLGRVKEGWIDHKIMAPFGLEGTGRLRAIAAAGSYRVDDEIAVIETENGESLSVSMRQRWPVKRAVLAYKQKFRPARLLELGIRSIDTLNPLPAGGTGFIPGPFGCGKTVLQHAMSINAAADLIIVIACGERANEVVEIFTEFPELDDPRTGRKLMERTTIICNTSNMPVAAREASVYTGMTIAEYYRAMGLNVLLLADSTSRWAQALREMSNRLEELPGPDAFPMDLSAVVAAYYARAGAVRLNNGETGSVTFVGTVSPAGGNLKEPVTESTRKAARCFYALSQRRADSKRYPAIDPLDSYSKYLEYPEFREHLEESIEPGWPDLVERARDVLRRGLEAYDQINILGDDSVPLEYHEDYYKSELIDFVILQQDAFDEIDQNTPLARQRYMLRLVMEICQRHYDFSQYEALGRFFKSLINSGRQMNYSRFDSDDFRAHEAELRRLMQGHARREEEPARS